MLLWEGSELVRSALNPQCSVTEHCQGLCLILAALYVCTYVGNAFKSMSKPFLWLTMSTVSVFRFFDQKHPDHYKVYNL